MKNLSVGIIQLNTVWENPQANKLKIQSLIKHDKKLDLLILPEMFLTGFSCDQFDNSALNAANNIEWLENFSNENQISIVGSLKIKDTEGNYRNRMYLTNPSAPTQHYDKRHLFPLSSERKNFARGSEKKTFKLHDWLLFPQICYDLRFPVWSRNTVNYDLMINVANWPAARVYAWRSLLIARAIENQCFVIGVNRLGSDKNGLNYTGDSLIISPQGEILLDALNEENLLTYQISKSMLAETRNSLPFLQDMDPFALNT